MINLATLSALALVLGYATFQRAGVEPGTWNLCLLAIGSIAVVYFAIPKRPEVRSLDRVVAFSAAAVMFLAAFQLVPLPVALLRVLSPTRVELLQATASLTGGPATYATLSAVPYQTAQYVLTLAGYLLIFLVIRDVCLRTGERTWSPAWPLLLVGGLEALLGVYQATSGATDSASGTYDNRDHYAGLLEMILPFAALYPAAILQRDRERQESTVAPAFQASLILAIAVVILAASIYSLSRMGFLASLAALFVAGASAVSARGWNVDYRKPAAWWRRMLPAASVGIVILLGFLYLPSDPLARRFADLAATEDISADTRAQIWRDTSGLIRAYPLFGCGLGGYESCFLRYKSVAPMNTVDYAHNDYLQVWAEFGVFGLIAGIIFVARLLYRSMRASLYAPSHDHRYLAIACTSSFVAILLHSSVDFNMYVPANGFVFAWVAGIAGAYVNRRE